MFSGGVGWSDLIFVAAVALATGTIIWTLRDKLSSRDSKFDDIGTKIQTIKDAIFERLDEDKEALQHWREGLGERLSLMEKEINKVIADSRHQLRDEIYARLLMIEHGFDKLNLEFVEHRTEDRGYFENLQMRVARLEPPPASPLVRRSKG